MGVVTAVNGTTTQTVTYTYDDAGDRVSESVNGLKTTYLNDPTQAYDQVLEEYAPGGVLAATYIRGLDLLFQDRTTAGGGTGLSYYAVDGLGSTRSLTNASGTVTDTYTYDPYGNPIAIASTGTTSNEYQYAGYQFDTVTGEDYLRARYYDAAAGQFTSRDDYDGSTDDPITENHYAYASADPINLVNPSGHDPEVEALAVTAGQGNLASMIFGAAQAAANAYLRIGIVAAQVQFVWVPRIQFWTTIISGASIFADGAAKAWLDYYGNPDSPDDIGRGNALRAQRVRT